MAVAASEGVELGVATDSLYLFLSEKVRLLGRNTVIMVVKYDYRQERVKWQQKKRMGELRVDRISSSLFPRYF